MFGAIFRFFRNFFNRKGQAIDRAADAQYTGSAQGIADGYDAANDQLVKDYRSMMEATATIETAKETKRTEATDLAAKIAAKEKALNGALAVIEKKDGREEQARKDYKAFKAELDAMHAESDQLAQDVKDIDTNSAELYDQLAKLRKQIANLPAEKAAAIGKFVSNKQLLDLYARMGNLKTASEKTPLDAIRAKLKEQDSQVRVSKNVTHAATSDRETDYTNEGEKTSADDDLNAILAQRAAAKAEKTGETPVSTGTDREKI